MKKYRIIEETSNFGTVYRVQERWWGLFWRNSYGDEEVMFRTPEDAKLNIDQVLKNKTVRSVIYEE